MHKHKKYQQSLWGEGIEEAISYYFRRDTCLTYPVREFTHPLRKLTDSSYVHF